MTTIVVDAALGFMAADRQATEDARPYEVSKIHRVPMEDGIDLVAVSGGTTVAKRFMEWYSSSDNWTPEKLDVGDDDFTAVVLTAGGEIATYDCWLRSDPVIGRFYATGTGGSYALGALRAGAGIDKAMRAALELDVYSGFGYDIEYIRKVNDG